MLIFYHTDLFYYIKRKTVYPLDFDSELKDGNLYVRSLYDCYNREFLKLDENFKELWWQNDGHHNSKGYKLMAKCIDEVTRPIVDSVYTKKMNVKL